MSWIDMNSLVIQDPVPILLHINKHHLQNDQHMGWVTRLSHNGDHNSLLSRAHVMMTKPYEKKFKFGVQIPRGTREAYLLDLQNGNTLWQEAIFKEVNQLNHFKTFIILDVDQDPPKGYSRIPYHIIYGVKWDGRRKARLVANGNMVDPSDDIYSGVVSIESLRISFLIAQLNDLNICAADISNAYLFAKAKEKVYFVAGKEFGKEMEGRILIIDKVLYGLPISGFQFHQHLATNLRSLGFIPSKSESAFWRRDREDHY